MGNLGSVVRAVEECGGVPLVTAVASDLAAVNSIILPGVGSFSQGIRNLRELGLEEALTEQVLERKVPFLGVCLGMQLMATKGWEGGESAGLAWIDGEVCRLEPNGGEERVPHVGWNEVGFSGNSVLFDGLQSNKDFYFVHSYHFQCRNENYVLARTPYCGSFVSVIGKERLFGVQFHPEKSQRSGFTVLKNFLKL